MARTIETDLPHRVTRDARLRESGERRTQADRSARMRRRLVDAALECLIESGVGQTSTDDIVRRAGVSRGALGHHFADKAELIAAAAWQQWNDHLERLADRLATALAARRPLADQLRIYWQETEAAYAVNAEIWLAARADPKLAAAYRRIRAAEPSPFANTSAVDWVRARDDDSPLLTRFVVGCFVNGLCRAALSNDRELLEAIFDKFARMLSLSLDAMGGVDDLPAAAPPGRQEQAGAA